MWSRNLQSYEHLKMRESWTSKYQWMKTEIFECDNGWDILLDKLFHIIDVEWKKMDVPIDERFSVMQVKEKFGTLRVYITGMTPGGVHGMIAMAESFSSTICERCGSSSGRLHGGGRIQTLCSACM